jgi:transposase-like protein
MRRPGCSLPGTAWGLRMTGHGWAWEARTQTGQTDTGPLALGGPRDRHGGVAPPLVPTRQRRVEGCDDHVVRLEARGLATRDLPGPLAARSGTAGSPTRISSSTDAVLEEGWTGQARPLASVSPRRSCAACCGPSRAEGAVQTQAVSRALGGTRDGEKARLAAAQALERGADRWDTTDPAISPRGLADGARLTVCCDAPPAIRRALETTHAMASLP